MFLEIYWIFGLGLSSGILKDTSFRKLGVFPSPGEGVVDILLATLEEANLSHLIEISTP
jgi:hypothetical protein